MATLNEMIAQGAQFNIPDPVAQYNKLAQMQQYKTQNELSQQEAIDKATERQRLVSERTRRATFLSGLSGKLAEKGYTLDRSTLSSMMSSGIPDIEKLAFEGFKALSAEEAFNKAGAEPSAAMDAAPTPMAAAAPAPAPAAAAPMFQPSSPRPIPKVGDTYPYTHISGPKEGTTETRIVTQADLDQLKNYRGPQVQLPSDLTSMPAPVVNAMVPQATPAPAAANAMAPAPTPAAAPTGELERLTAQRNRYSKISPQTPGDVAKLKNILDGIDKQIERLTTTGSSLSKLIAERDRLPAGDPRIATFDNAILKESQNVAKAEPLADFAAFLRLSPTEQDTFLKFKRAGAGNVSATATTGPVGKSLSEPVGKRVETSLLKAEGATSMMDTANSVREALNAGNVIAGPLAGVRTKFAQVLELAGAGDKEKLVNTRTAIQGLAGLTLESRAELRGQGQITDTETKLLEKARSADINDLTIPELQQVVDVSQRLASRLYSNHQTLLDRMKDDPAAKDSMRYYEPTSKLSPPVLQGKTPAAQSKDEKRPSLNSIFGNPPQGVK